MGFWRNYRPKLPSEKSETEGTPYALIFGLAGLQTESTETNGGLNNLTTNEANIACRYAFNEFNGFPDWFPDLYKKFPNLVSSYVLKEIKWELKNEQANSHEMTSKVAKHAQWLWNDIAPEILKKLNEKIVNHQHLNYFLIIIQGSSVISDEDIANLASSRCCSSEHSLQIALWFAVWMGVDPLRAIPSLEAHLEKTKDKEDVLNLAMEVITNLTDSGIARANFKTPEYLKNLYLLMHKYIRVEEDLDRPNYKAYSPELRDDAQLARERLLSILKEYSGKCSFLALKELSKTHPVERYKKWLLQDAKHRAATDADLQSWTVQQFLDFSTNFENTPGNHQELFNLTTQRLKDLQHDLENGDNSAAPTWKNEESETRIRNLIGGWCRDKSSGKYSISHEDELSDGKKPDLRFVGVSFDAPVPVELKLADNWSGPQLFERLENQLCGDYLRDKRSCYGVFLLVYRGTKHCWEIPNGNKKANFNDLLEGLRNKWNQISENYSHIDKIEIIGIDLSKRTTSNK